MGLRRFLSRYDLLIKGGLLVDPAQEINEKRDVAFLGGKVAAVEVSIPASSADKVVDAEGKIVTPGLIDLHTHVYYHVSPRLGVEPDSSHLMKGATTVLDVGSAGFIVFPGFRKHVIERAKTRIYALVCIGSLGLITFGYDNIKSTLLNMELIDVDATVKCIEENRDVVKGVKWHRMYGQKALIAARQAADRAGCLLMCENSAIYWHPLDVVLKYLRSGDVLTHCFQGGPAPTVLDEDGNVRPEVEKAVRRGVVLDVGHGMGSFSFSVAERAILQGLLPTTVSTDLHMLNINGPVYDIGTTLSKFLLLGLTLEQVIERATINPAKVLGVDDRLGHLKPDAVGDAVVWQLLEGRFPLRDVLGVERIGQRLLGPVNVISSGSLAR